MATLPEEVILDTPQSSTQILSPDLGTFKQNGASPSPDPRQPRTLLVSEEDLMKPLSITEKLGSGPNGEMLKPGCDNETCGEEGGLFCTHCHLVQYCSKDCQTSHWRAHKKDCKAEVAKEGWIPADGLDGIPRVRKFPTHQDLTGKYTNTTSYLFGNTPPTDILNLEGNEGLDYAKDLDLLFAASGDPRIIMKTVNSVPDTYPGKLSIVVNDKDLPIGL